MQLISNRQLQIVAVLLILFGLFSGLSALELRAEEPRRALVALEMWINGEYIIPTLHDWTYLNKPPLFNWVLLAFFKIFGSAEEWVVRLPGMLSFLATGGLIYFFLKTRIEKEWALLAMLAYWTSLDLFFYGAVNTGEIDLFFSLLVLLQSLWVFTFYEKKQYALLFSGAYLIGVIAFLTKGIPAVLFTVFTVAGWLIWERRWKLIFSWYHLLGVIISLSALSVYIYAYSTRADLSIYLAALFKDATRKSAVESSIWEIIGHIFTFPFEVLFILLPWSLLLIFLFGAVKQRILKKVPSYIPFLLVFLLCNIWVYWISPDTRNRYVYPFIPAIMMLLFWLGSLVRKINPRTLLWVVITIAIARVMYNFIGMPYQQKTSDNLIYRQHCREILSITGNEPVYLLGLPYCEEQEGNRVAMYFDIKEICGPPLVPYQIPYYLTKANKKLMTYKEVPVAGEYYIGEKEFVSRFQPRVLYSFKENWIKNELVLFRKE